MATKAFKAGSEVDAWCTKCRMDLGHRVIAMNGDKIEQVECRTCSGHHKYRKPKSAASEAKAKAETKTKATPTAGSSARPKGAGKGMSTGPKKGTSAAEAERLRAATWQKMVAGQPITSFKPYRPSLSFEAGDLIRHTKFGDGYIVRVVDRQKLEAMFEDGPRMLAQALDL